MSAFLIWVVSPAVIALGLLVVRASRRASTVILSMVSFWLAVAARWLAPGSTLSLRGLIIYVQPRTAVFGRILDFAPPADGLLFVWFLSLAFWMGGMTGVQVPRSMPAWSVLIAVGALTVLRLTSLSVGLLGLLFLLLAVLAMALALGADATGVVRLVAQTVWGGLILLFAWFVIAGGEVVPLSAQAQRQAMALLGVGLGLLLSVPPFVGGWMRAFEAAEPYGSAFLGWLWGTTVLLLALTWLDSTAWLRESGGVAPATRLGGAVLVALTGLAASATDRPGRWVAAATLSVVGWGLLSLGSGEFPAWTRFLALWWPHLIALLGLGLALSRLEGLEALPEHPLVAMTTLVALMALAGMPFLAAFPPRLSVYLALSTDTVGLLLAFLGSVTWLVPVIRVFLQLFPFSGWALPRGAFLVFVPLVLILMGLFPALFSSLWQPLASFFPNFP